MHQRALQHRAVPPIDPAMEERRTADTGAVGSRVVVSLHWPNPCEKDIVTPGIRDGISDLLLTATIDGSARDSNLTILRSRFTSIGSPNRHRFR